METSCCPEARLTGHAEISHTHRVSIGRAVAFFMIALINHVTLVTDRILHGSASRGREARWRCRCALELDPRRDLLFVRSSDSRAERRVRASRREPHLRGEETGDTSNANDLIRSPRKYDIKLYMYV